MATACPFGVLLEGSVRVPPVFPFFSRKVSQLIHRCAGNWGGKNASQDLPYPMNITLNILEISRNYHIIKIISTIMMMFPQVPHRFNGHETRHFPSQGPRCGETYDGWKRGGWERSHVDKKEDAVSGQRFLVLSTKGEAKPLL